MTTEAQKKMQPVCPLGEGWEYDPEFSDEFNSKDLDGNKWWDFNPEWYGRKPGYFSRENVRVSKGMLCLSARSQKPGKVTAEHKARGYDKFTTSSAKSKKRVHYGYFEARCKSMKAGVCNAFWLYDPLDPKAKYHEGSFSEEIDIMFDCEIMPDWVGLPEPSDLPATFYIDYLRVWKSINL